MNDYNPYADPNYYRAEFRAASGAKVVYVAHLVGQGVHRVSRTSVVAGSWCVAALPGQIHDFASQAEAEVFAAQQAEGE